MHDDANCPYVGEYEQLASENADLRAACKALLQCIADAESPYGDTLRAADRRRAAADLGRAALDRSTPGT